MVLPNMNFSAMQTAQNTTAITEQMQHIIDYIKDNGQITDEEIGELLNLKKTRIFDITTKMRDMGLIYVQGRGKSKVYLLK